MKVKTFRTAAPLMYGVCNNLGSDKHIILMEYDKYGLTKETILTQKEAEEKGIWSLKPADRYNVIFFDESKNILPDGYKSFGLEYKIDSESYVRAYAWLPAE